MRHIAVDVLIPSRANRISLGVIRRARKLGEFTRVPVIIAVCGPVKKEDNTDLTHNCIASRNEHQPLLRKCSTNHPERGQQQLQEEERQGGFDIDTSGKTRIGTRELGYPQ